MKFILQIALGVFLGTLASQITIDSWHGYQESLAKEAEKKRLAEEKKVRVEEGERIRALLLQGRQGKSSDQNNPISGEAIGGESAQ